MASASIEVILQGDARGLVRSLEDAEKELKDLQKQLKVTTDGKEFERLSVQVAKVKNEIKGINTAAASGSLKKLGKSSVDASGDLINLGRVVQDAPFGFLGIANNLNPLIEGFKRTTTQAGGLKGGLKALGQSLTGAGGLSLLISAVSTAAILFGDKLFAASKAADEAAEKSKKLKDAVKGIFDEVGREGAQVGGLIAVLKSETETRERKIAALKELKQIQPEIFNQLKLEGNLVAGVDAAYQAYLKNLKNVVAAKIKQAQLEQKISELLTLQGATQTRSEKAVTDGIKNFQKSLADLSKGTDGVSIYGKEIEKAADKTKKSVATIEGDIKGLIDDLTQLSKGVEVKIDKPKTDAVDKFFNDTIRRAKELSAFIEKTSFFDATLIFNPEDTKPQQLRQALDFIERALNRAAGLGGGGLRLKAPIDFEADRFKFIKTAKYFEEQKKFAQDFREDLQKAITALTKTNPILVAFEANQKQIKANGDLLKSALKGGDFNSIATALAEIFSQAGKGAVDLNNKLFNIATTANNILTPAFTNLFAAIVAGENPLKAFFKSIQQAIGQLIQKLIAAVIQALILRAIFGGKAGSFGDLFKSFAGFREQGGPVQAGKSYVVGENGPEIFTAGRSGQIIPNGGMGSVGALPVAQASMSGMIQIRGRDLALVLGRQQGFNNRNF